MDYKQAYNKWITDKYFDSDTKSELLAIKNDEKEIEDRFYKDLEFGTGGLRGIIGAGTNRINIYTVSKATQGLADYILKDETYEKNKGVCIGYDSRHMSHEFAEITALVLNGNGIKTYLFDTLCPTPVVSFSIIYLKCIAGVVITASHNPAKYNGYKVYGQDGGQVPYPKDKEIIAFVNKVDDYSAIKKIDKNDAISSGLFNIIGENILNKYYDSVMKQSINVYDNSLKIVYTPLHGTGNIPVRKILETATFKNVHIVKEQEMPDGNFPTVTYPNPEDINAFSLATKLCSDINGDIIIGTDPDADRLGAVVKDNNGKYIALTGNMIGTLLTEYILSKKNNLSQNDTIISTIVSSNMTKEIAKYYGVSYIEVLTGFKFIGEKIKQFENTEKNFIFGFEESYGFLAGTYARDKDAICASLLLCELASYYKSKNLSLYDGLNLLYEKYGYFKESLHFIVLSGINGLKKIKNIMEYLRNNPPKNINGHKVIETRDYFSKKIKNILTNEKNNTNLPSSNVLYFSLEDKSWFCVRPSGTEPKIKIYFGVNEKTNNLADDKLQKLIKTVVDIINNI